MTSKERFNLALAALAEVHDKELTAVKLRAYASAISGVLTIDQFEHACHRALTELKFFPKPAELIELGLPSIEQRIEEGWLKFNDAVDRVGGTCSVEFAGDPVLTHTINALGGWRYLADGNHSVSEWNKWVRRDFEKSYRVALSMPVEALNTRRLIGRHDARNQAYTPKIVGGGAPGIEHKREPEGLIADLAEQKALASG